MPASKRKPAAKPKGPATRPALHSIAEFARHLDLSAWTVSRAINGHPEVNEKTRQRVFAAMNELGFRPNPLARGLGGRRTGMIGVCFMGLGNPIVDQKVFALQEFFRRRQLQTVLEVRMRDQAQELNAIENFRRIHVEGIVLLYSELDAAAAANAVQDTPCVQVDPHQPQKLPTVSLDRRRAMQLLMDHLTRLEHETFGLLETGRQDVWRWPALLEIARARRLDPEKIFVHFEDLRHIESPIQRGQMLAQAVLDLKRRPTALITANDQMAVGVIQTLREASVAVPRQISVTGFDHLDLGRRLHPTLTTIDQNYAQMMERAGVLLLEQIKLAGRKRGDPVQANIMPALVVGESTGPAPLRG
jgi:DNA-binding LacI/PurR family transcriptional regulator